MSDAPNRPGTPALLLDAMGTTVRLIPPAPALTRALATAGYPNSEDRVAVAMRAHIAHSRPHHLGGRPPAEVGGLRRACAEVLARELAIAPPVDRLTELLLGALRFEAYPEVLPVLGALRARGVRVAVVSDWDCTLAEHLVGLGIRERVDAVVVSAVVGVAKPDPRLFAAALSELGLPADAAVVCGDDPARDLAGARAAGIRGVLMDRAGRHPDVAPRVGTLAELAEWV